MTPISSSTDIARPPEEVFAYVTDPRRFVEWQAHVVDGREEGEAPHDVGERCLTTRRIAGAERPAAQRERFLGSPTIRVNRHDVEPGADARNDFGRKCRLYQTPQGLRGSPLDEWLLDALNQQPA